MFHTHSKTMSTIEELSTDTAQSLTHDELQTESSVREALRRIRERVADVQHLYTAEEGGRKYMRTRCGPDAPISSVTLDMVLGFCTGCAACVSKRATDPGELYTLVRKRVTETVVNEKKTGFWYCRPVLRSTLRLRVRECLSRAMECVTPEAEQFIYDTLLSSGGCFEVMCPYNSTEVVHVVGMDAADSPLWTDLCLAVGTPAIVAGELRDGTVEAAGSSVVYTAVKKAQSASQRTKRARIVDWDEAVGETAPEWCTPDQVRGRPGARRWALKTPRV